MKHAFLLLFLALGFQVAAQKRDLIQDKDAILARASEELDAAMAPGGALYEAINEEGLTGVMTARISFRDKGDVSSVFVVDYTGGDIRSQNRFKDLLHGIRFGFKTPKGKQYRLEKEFVLSLER
ncbi:MAG: hypothetical protein KDB96_09915 [Flavobacteriales bacterium]|nr:hypothetical protein [Flavobacteriales bacterium]MCB0809582.1 hypothetical protein [Flavobacteriales bacterium]